MPYQHKPDISVKFSPRIARSTSVLVGQVCVRWDMFESDALRFCLEAIAPEAARRGLAWLIRQIPNFNRLGEESYSFMVTVRTSRAVKSDIDSLSLAGRRHPEEYSEADVLRFCYLAILPIALRDGFAPVMRMREKNQER